MNKRKILSLALGLCMVAILAIGGTLAYFTDSDDATNTFTIGNVEIDLTEPKWDEAGTVDAPEVYPGEALAKDPTVENTGANPCFVRIKVEGLDCLAPAGLITFRTDYVAGISEDWEEYDGYYYYKTILAAGDTTDALFDQIVIPTDLTNDEHASASYNIDVKAEAIQAQGALGRNWTGVQTMTVAEIATWFEQEYK